FAVTRSPQVAVSAARWRMPALPRCGGCASRVLAHWRLRQVAGERSRRRLRVLRGNHRAVATLSRAEALAVTALPRAGELSGGDPQRFSARAVAGRAHYEAARARTAGSGPAQRSVLPLSIAERCWLRLRHAEPRDFAARGSPRTGILVQRDNSWPLRVARLHRQPSHHPG